MQAAAAGVKHMLLQEWVVCGVGGAVLPALNVLLGLAGMAGRRSWAAGDCDSVGSIFDVRALRLDPALQMRCVQ